MDELYDFQDVEPRISDLWEEKDCFATAIDSSRKPFSMYLTPPNASGPMHIGNALMIAIQDILARYYRALGKPTLWVPGIDHGGYETQVTFEKNLEKESDDKSNYSNAKLYDEIKKFVDRNSTLIKHQIRRMGASVDWTRFRFTMDETSLKSVVQTFQKMVSQNLIYRRPYMVYYCPSCSTLLSDIELKEIKEEAPEYFIKFPFENSDQYLVLATTRPEFLFAATYVLIDTDMPNQEYKNHIGKTLINPTTGSPVKIIAGKRKFNPEKTGYHLAPFSPSYLKYDYEYTLRNNLPSQNLLDWEGKLIERHPGNTPAEAREKEITFLQEHSSIDHIDQHHEISAFLCKKEHHVESLIIFTWFLKFDDEKTPLRQPTLDAIKREGLMVFPKWREKGLFEWIGKMPDWPIARQNIWGIKIPIWYEISNPAEFLVWFIDRQGNRQYGNLKNFLDHDIPFEEITSGLQRMYAMAGDARWVLEKEPGKLYLPETDSFDTWFSSGQWASLAFGDLESKDFTYFYPSQSTVLGYDLIRLSIARKLILSYYLTGKLPFKIVYLHRLIKGNDNRKMSKSLENAVPLEYYLDTYGVDATRMALISYTMEREDFMLTEDRLNFFKQFGARLWELGHLVDLANQHSIHPLQKAELRPNDKKLVMEIEALAKQVGMLIEKYSFENAEDALCHFLPSLENYAQAMQAEDNVSASLSVLKHVYKEYLILLHPFMPFMTEGLNSNLYVGSKALAATGWPTR
jgi:valyl-tRNA synthetase